MESSKQQPDSRAVSLAPSDQLSDPFEIFVPGPTKNTGAPIASRVDLALKARIASVVQGGKMPFRTESDYVRSAVVYFEEHVVAPRLEKRFQDDVQMSNMMVRRAQQLARLNAASKFAHDTKEALLLLAGEEAWEHAVGLWLETMEFLEKAEEPFRTSTRRKLMEDPRLQHVKRRAEQQDVQEQRG